MGENVADTDRLPSHLDGTDIETGVRVAESPVTGRHYTVTKWAEADATGSRLIALEKEPLDDDEGPEPHRAGAQRD